MMEDDICVIKFGFYRAHFAAYQTETSEEKEFCEDLPDTGATVFVLNYLHNSLQKVPVDFRIITDITGLGRYAQWQDIEKIDDIDQYSVHYQPASVQPQGSLTIRHTFMEAGDYIGIVTAKHPSTDQVYRAVFPFQVGKSRFGYWLFVAFVGLLVWMQIRFRSISYLFTRLKAKLPADHQ